jgi:hypothetical protein
LSSVFFLSGRLSAGKNLLPDPAAVRRTAFFRMKSPFAANFAFRRPEDRRFQHTTPSESVRWFNPGLAFNTIWTHIPEYIIEYSNNKKGHCIQFRNDLLTLCFLGVNIRIIRKQD